VHGIVKSCGGEIVVESEVGRGTVFSLFFPASQAAASELEAEIGTLPRGNERILLVDDEPMIVDFAKRALEFLGYRVAATTSSKEALALFQADPEAFNLVITDQTMPEIEGTELARAIVTKRPQTPVILCTGYSSKVSPESAISFGVKAFAMKPLTMKSLATLARKALDG
jgi:DNA-binding NtrC family response regulator